MSSVLGHPTCTAEGCRHELTHPHRDALLAFVAEHQDQYVSQHGDAVCLCHAPAVADRLRVPERFPCDASEAS